MPAGQNGEAMSRAFLEHKKRKVATLDGVWRFSTDRENVGLGENWQKGIPSSDTQIVPSVWNTKMGLLDYEGVCWYERDFYTEGGTLRFCFGSVLTDCTVWLDGENIGSHYGGFCAFELIADDVTEGEHTLTVRVDNSFDEESIPQRCVDWYHYGGITRSVSVERLEGICVLSSRLEYELSPDMKKARARAALELYNASNDSLSDNVSVSVLGATIEQKVECLARESKEIFTNYFEIDGFDLWSPTSPKLYELKTTTATDDLYDRVGFRLVSVDKSGILINRKRVELRGVNRHEEHVDFGFAFPPALMQRDIDIAVNMGCNALRGSHYPNDPLFVDMLDERGVLFFSEIAIWGGGFSKETLANPKVVERGLNMHKEMVKHYYNHPSIIIWGMHNEILTDTPEGVEMSRLYYSYLKENGGNRLVTYATNHPLTDLCFEYCDFISINMYIGWYGEKKEEWAAFLDKVRARLSSLGFSDKPVVMSEFGAAAVFGHRSFDNTIWSEQYQADLISHCLSLFHADGMVCGSYIWHMCDARTLNDLTRARGFNNKGLLNEYRQPKAAYFAARELYLSFAAENEKEGNKL